MKYVSQGRTVGVFAPAIILPCLLAACTSWQPQELNTLPGAILQEQPTRIQVSSPRMGTVEIDDPEVLGDVLFGLGHREGFTNQELMRIPFSEMTEASLRAFDGARSAILGAVLLFTVAAVVAAEASSFSSGP